MNKLLLLSLVLLASCYSDKKHEEQTDFKTNLDSLFEAADGEDPVSDLASSYKSSHSTSREFISL